MALPETDIKIGQDYRFGIFYAKMPNLPTLDFNIDLVPYVVGRVTVHPL